MKSREKAGEGKSFFIFLDEEGHNLDAAQKKKKKRKLDRGKALLASASKRREAGRVQTTPFLAEAQVRALTWDGGGRRGASFYVPFFGNKTGRGGPIKTLSVIRFTAGQ